MIFFLLDLLLIAINALADPPDPGQEKPAIIQDGAPAQADISSAIYEHLQ
jgi:hypothetical protein